MCAGGITRLQAALDSTGSIIKQTSGILPRKIQCQPFIPAREPTERSWACSSTMLQYYVFFSLRVADHAGLCILFFVNSCEHLKIKKPQVY